MASSQALNGVTHYQILNLTPTLLDSQNNPAALIKRAYHRALLRNHPDKATTTTTTSTTSSFFTIDQITTAANVLSSPSSRAAYDAALRVSRSSAAAQARDATFQTGVENVDLDDLAWDEAEHCWYRSCRCGNDRGYLFKELDLEEAGEDSELVVGCLDCSLWLKVHFAVVEEDEDEVPPNQTDKEKS